MKKRITWSFLVLFLAVFFISLVSSMTVTINIPEKYSEVSNGERLYFETEVKWPENVERRDLRMEYTIKSQNDEKIAYLKVLKAIETQASFMDSINIPEGTSPGTYTLFLVISDYGQLDQEVAVSFRVIESSEDSFRFYLLVILAFVGLIAIISLVEVFILIRKRR